MICKPEGRVFHPIEDAIEDIRLGKMVIVVDDEDRENEGDLVMAAELARPEDINFMVTHARGLLCVPVTIDQARRLKPGRHGPAQHAEPVRPAAGLPALSQTPVQPRGTAPS